MKRFRKTVLIPLMLLTFSLGIAGQANPSAGYDKYSTTIIIIDTIECVADFEYVLDSNSNTVNKFKFFDLSQGNPDYWYWDFGDGFFSTEQNPVHTFQQEGQYTVCLAVANGNFINCVDTICKEVKMPEYFSFGGFAFAGDHPINNPVHSGDTGLALLYKKYSDDQVLLLDTNKFYEFGYYHFSNKLPGEYIVKIMLLPNSTHYNNYLTSYYPDQHYWNQAHSVFIGDTNAYNMHVHLLEIHGAEQGSGSISGKVVEEKLSPFERPYPPLLTEVVLSDPDGSPLDFTFCDQDGKFVFSNLAYGQYKLFVDHTGKYALPVLIKIDEVQPFVDTLKITLSDHSLAAIEDFMPDDILSVGNVYPNPVSENVQLTISIRKQSQLEVNIMNLVGQRILYEEFNLAAGKQRIQLNTSGLPSGLYHLQIITSAGESISRKLIKY